MAEYKVLITTSGIGSRLGNLTTYTNKSLVRVGKKPAISYIIESYEHDVEFVITCGHFGNHVKDFLNLAYPERIFTFVDIDNFQGVGSSLGYSMLKAKDYLQCPFIFHASDTIVTTNIPIPTKNWLGYNKKENYSQYRTLDIINPKIFDKGHIGYNNAYIGLCGIKDFSIFWDNLESEYNKNPNDSSLSDCHSINKFIDNSWDMINFKEWLDIGNVSELSKSRNIISDNFHILDKEDESIFIFDDFVIKFFYDKEINLNRVSRGLNLFPLTPKIIGYKDNFYKYELAKGQVLSNIVNEKIFSNFIDWTLSNLWKKKDSFDKFSTNVFEFYFTKTINRVNRFLKEQNIVDGTDVINGMEVPPVSEMIKTIDKDWMCDAIPYQFHGDFILDNIIYDGSNFTLLDWRQDFNGDIENGDIYYDIAKLNHNLLFNHDIVNKDLYSLEISKDGDIRCDILRSDILTNCRELLHKLIIERGFDLKKVRILTALIWLNMSPLHEPKIGKFLFYLGKINLYKSLND